jgi:hypothetical protein
MANEFEGWYSWFEAPSSTIDNLYLRAIFFMRAFCRTAPPTAIEYRNAQLVLSFLLRAEVSDSFERRVKTLYAFDAFYTRHLTESNHERQLQAEIYALEKYSRRAPEKHRGAVDFCLRILVE